MMHGLWIDNRVGGCPAIRLCDDRDLMRVPDDLRDCVCFVQAIRAGAQSSVGSAFFVGIDVGTDDFVLYVVTAKHCILDDISENPLGTRPDEVVLLVNRRAGGRDAIRTDACEWQLHPTADLAVLPLLLDRKTYQYRVYPLASTADEEFIEDRQIGPGDDVFMPGLLVHHPGNTAKHACRTPRERRRLSRGSRPSSHRTRCGRTA